ncbi:MFS general substrate transporter [Polychaeton citri CBS 116435]|uniref:MFS general substrate transporter n=1 Tax=Polychaeton citri CBS 116435 TaxID=1314669 RepID=A0A9P4Q7M4_9PEZI|nr:MFS general substrate transporter [Polychaeton citri CBS 116435]
MTIKSHNIWVMRRASTRTRRQTTALLSDNPDQIRRESVASKLSQDSQRTASESCQHQDAQKIQSSTSSVRQAIVRVPRNQRRGLLARLTLVPEVTNPYDYNRGIKWFLCFVVAVAGAVAPMGSSIILPALIDITETFNSTSTVVNMSISFYMLSMSIFPLWWSSFSETLGRRTIYLTSFALFVIFNVLGAVSVNVAMFIVMRILSGGAAASVQAVGAGTISDVFEVRERGRAMGIFYLGPLCGPLLSPIIGGAMAETLGWRSIQWFLVGFGGCVFIFVLFALPETLKERKPLAADLEQQITEPSQDSNGNKTGPKAFTSDITEKDNEARPTLVRTTTRQSVAIKSRSYLTVLRRSFIDPLRIVLYLQFPAIAIVVAFSSVTFSSLYILNISVQQTFSAPPYSYGSLIVGLLYLPNSLGYFLSSIFGGRWVDKIMAREAKKAGRYDIRGKLIYRPEDRMRENAWLGATVFPLALIVYGWTARFGVTVAAPMVANFFFGTGSMLVFAVFTTMLTEFMPRKASHGVALNNFVRNIFSCIGSVVAEPLIVAIGNGWLFTILGLVSIISGYTVIWAMKRYSDHWRVSMDKKIEKAMGS